MKNVTVTFLLLFSTSLIYSQSNLLFNPMLYNSAIAGQNEITEVALTGFNIQTPLQGIGYNGQTLNFSTSIKDGRFGVGGNIVRREMIFDDVASFDGFLAYHKSVAFGKLSLGTAIGATKNSYDLSNLSVGSSSFVSESATNYYFNLGLGAMFTSKYGYLGVSTPNIFRKERRVTLVNSQLYDYTLFPFRQVILSGGLRFPMFSEKLIVRPSIIYTQSLERTLAATDVWSELQLNVSLQLFDKIWLNAAVLPPMTELIVINQTMEFGAGYSFRNGLRLGANYRLYREGVVYSPDIIEVVVGYRMDKNGDFDTTKRHFF